MWVELLLRGSASLTSREQADAFDQLGVSRATDLGAYNLRIAAGLLGLLAVGPASLYILTPKIGHEGSQARYSIAVPRTHRRVTSEATDVTTGYALGFGTIYEAANPHVGLELYRFVYLEMPNKNVGAVKPRDLLGGVDSL